MTIQPIQDIRVSYQQPDSPIFDCRHPDWPRPGGSSGGTSAFAWSAPNGLADGELITITSDTHAFVQPAGYAYMGFGTGWLASAADGTKFITHTVDTALGTESIVAEDPPEASRRSVFTLSGQKWLRSLLSGSSAPVANSGFINWDLGRNIAPLEHAFQYSRARITPRPEDAAKLFQLKQDRIGATQNLGGTGDEANSCYIKQGPGTTSMATDAYPGTSGAQAYYFDDSGQQSDGQVTDFAWSWLNNTPDGSDGDQWVICAKEGSYTRVRPDFSGPLYPTNIIRSTSSLRPRWLKWQDYLGNDSSVVDLEILRTDMFMQVGGSLFFIADNPDPLLCTKFCPLVPTAFNGGNNWTFRLWRGSLSDYSNAAVFMLNERLNLIVGVSLT